MGLTLNSIIALQEIQQWPEKLLQSDRTGKNLLRVYRLLCEMEEGTKLLSLFMEKMQGLPSLLPARHLRSDAKLMGLLRRRLTEKRADELMPTELWGKVASYLLKDEEKSLLALTQTCRVFRRPQFTTQVVKAHPWLMLDVREAIVNKKPLVPASFYKSGSFNFFIDAIFVNLAVLSLRAFDELPIQPNALETLANTFSRVQKIDLSDSTLTPEHMAKLACFKDLKELCLSKCTFQSEALSLLPDTLTVLDLTSCKLQDGDLVHLLPLRKLTLLDLSRNALTGAAFERLLPFATLTSLNIGRNDKISAEDLVRLPPSVKSLECGKELKKAAEELLAFRKLDHLSVTPECIIL